MLNFDHSIQVKAKLKLDWKNLFFYFFVIFCRAKIFKEPIQVDSMFIDSELELLREFVYKSYLRENADQEANFLSIISKRLERAIY